eukprot:scaffold8_cov249-Pinguiococcus_pyrenoidosus.AAC.18
MPTVREMLAKLPPNRPEQCFSIVAVHGLALATFAMVLQWCKEDFPDGIGTGSWDSSFSWEEGDAHVFNWHPVLMVTAFVFIFAEAAIAYTWLPVSKPVRGNGGLDRSKKVGAASQGFAAVADCKGDSCGVAVCRNHRHVRWLGGCLPLSQRGRPAHRQSVQHAFLGGNGGGGDLLRPGEMLSDH